MSDEGKLDHQQAITRAFESSTDAIKIRDATSNIYTTIIDEPDSSTTYVGKAIIGTSTSAPSWQIQRLAVSGTVTTVLWADGNSDFDNIWTMRASLTYS